MLFVMLQAWLAKGQVYATLALAPAAFIGTSVVVLLTQSFGAKVEDSMLGLIILFTFVYCFAEILCAVLIHVLVPRIQDRPTSTQGLVIPEAALPPETFTPKGGGMVQFASRAVLADSILRIGAQGNYVQIVTDTDTFLEAGPLKVVVARLPEGLGAIVHRSYWVAWREVKHVRVDGRSTILELRTGTIVPVARSKRGVIPADLIRS